MSAPNVPSGVAGYCPSCSTPYGLAHVHFCRRCGHPVGPVPAGAARVAATAYPYPLVASGAVARAQHKLGGIKLVICGALGLAVLVVVTLVAATALRPSVNYCHFNCGPEVGPRLLSTNFYQSSEFAYRVEYNPGELSAQDKTPSEVELTGDPGSLEFRAVSGQDVPGAIRTAISDLDGSTFQDVHMTSSGLPGAEIGLVLGSGEVYTATYVPPGGGSSFPVAIAVMAATQGDITITALGVSDQNLQSAFPFGLEGGFEFDYSVTNTIWPGQA